MPTSSEVIQGKWNLSVKLPRCIDRYNNEHPTEEYRIIEFTTPDCINLIYLAMEKEIMNVLVNISRFRKRKESKESVSEYLQNPAKRRRTNDEFSLEDLLDCFMINPHMISNVKWNAQVKLWAASKNPLRPNSKPWNHFMSNKSI